MTVFSDLFYYHNIVTIDDDHLAELLCRANDPDEDPETWNRYDQAVFKIILEQLNVKT